VGPAAACSFGVVTIPGYYQHVEDCKKDGERIEKESNYPNSPTPKMLASFCISIHNHSWQ
jgi:hypothetical protein